MLVRFTGGDFPPGVFLKHLLIALDGNHKQLVMNKIDTSVFQRPQGD